MDQFRTLMVQMSGDIKVQIPKIYSKHEFKFPPS